MKRLIIAVIFFACITNVFAQTRTFNDIFPNIGANIRTAAFSSSGYARSSQRTSGFVIASQGSRLDPQIVNNVLRRSPGYLIESIMVIPGNPGSVTLLDVYNALRNVRDLRGRLYDSATRNQAVPLFEDATRIVSERQTSAIPDPPAATTLPRSETVYIRLKDANFSNTYYRAEMSLTANGLCYTMINFRSMSYLLVPVIREEKFIAQLYFEPIQEGILLYSIAGVDISDFFASRIHIDSAISKRLTVITSWAIDGIRRNSR
ncbi:MAG: hypothetical protein LBI28_07155 [Treponema sp.]|jgi:hypothetical protein|nr:hypothetical protein [Treponema sp.]